MKQTVAERVGANVRAEMTRAGISQTELAAVLGVSQPALSKRLLGKQVFDVEELTRVAEALRLDVAELLIDKRQSAATT